MKNRYYIENEQKKLYEFLKDILFSCRICFKEIKSAQYHHNIPYNEVEKVIKNGILSLKERAKLEGRTLTKDEINKFCCDYHINGISCISLSSLDVDLTKMHEHEMLYNPFHPACVDILISNDVKTVKNTKNYYNEFLAFDCIMPNFFRAIDIRLLELISNDQFLMRNKNLIYQVVRYYNSLKIIATEILKSGLDIPIREMSSEKISLDIHKIAKLPNVRLKI